MSFALLLALSLAVTPAAQVPVAVAPTDPAIVVHQGDLTVRTGNGCSAIEGDSLVPVMPGTNGPVRFERKMWLNLREEIRSGTVRVEQQGTHLRAIVDYSVADLPKDRAIPTCLYEAELTLLVWDLPTGEYDLEFSKAPKTP